MQAGGHEFDSRILHSVSKETVMYLENCIQRKSMIKIISYIKTSEVMLLTNINDDSIESFEENEVKQLAYYQRM